MGKFKIRRPSISLLASTNLEPQYYHSMLISLLRGLAALQVAAAHVRAQTMPSLRTLPDPDIWYQGLAFFTGFAHQAVLIFFLLSGWLVGGSMLNKWNSQHAIFDYAIDRVTRLWIVLVPAFLATICFAVLSNTVDHTEFDHSAHNEYSLSAFFGNLVGLQDIAVPRFGGNFALWSLSFESWYYVLYPLLLASFAAKRTTSKIAAATAAIIIASYLSNALLLYFLIWLLGTAFSRIKVTLDRPSQTVLVAIFIATAVFFRLNGENNTFTEESFLQDLLYSAIFLILLCSQQRQVDIHSRRIRRLDKMGRFLSNFSFTLYVIHVPLLYLFLHISKSFFGIDRLSPDQPSHYAIYFAMLGAIVVCAYCFYLLFEANTYKVRAHLKRSILALSSRTPRRLGLGKER